MRSRVGRQEAAAAEGAGGCGGGARRTRPKLAIEVVWGDVTKVVADVYTVGHYDSVLPQRAELALDEAVTGVLGKKDYDPRSLVITQHTRRGNLRAEVGDVSFFPWGEENGAGRVVAVAGMGRPGTFDTESLRRLVHSTAIAVAALPRRAHGVQRPHRLRRGDADDRRRRARDTSRGSRMRPTRSQRAATTCSRCPSRS